MNSWQVDNDVIIFQLSIVNLVKQTLPQRLIQKKLQNQKKMNLMNFWTWDRKNKVIWHRQCLSSDQIRKFMISRNRLIIYTKEKPHLEKISDHQQRKKILLTTYLVEQVWNNHRWSRDFSDFWFKSVFNHNVSKMNNFCQAAKKILFV